MIILEHCAKTTGSAFNKRTVLSSVNLQIPSERRIALVGPSDVDKAALINLIAGVAMPTEGRVVRKSNVSFPVGSLPGFSKDLSVRVNVAHVARLYGADVKATLEIVESVFRRPPWLDRLYDDMPKDIRRPLGQVVALTIPFDTYLLSDDTLRAPRETKRSRETSRRDFAADIYPLFVVRAETAGIIISTDDLEFAQQHCEMALFLNQGRLRLVDDIGTAFQHLARRRQEPSIESK